MKLIALTLATALSVVALPAQAGPGHDHHHGKTAEIDKPAPDFTLTDIDGKERTLSEFRGKYVVLEWNNPDCPFVRKHYGSGNMQALQAKYRENGVIWFTICSSGPGKQGFYEPDALKKMLSENKWSGTAYLRDTEGTVGRTYAAKTTPHMYVIDPNGVLIYAGAIDDKPSTKQGDIEGATNYVAASVDAAMGGRTVAVKTTTPYGCSVKYAPSSGH